MTFLSTKKALINIALLKKNYFISSFPGKIVFGEIGIKNYISNRHFVIFRCELGEFFEAIVKTYKLICSKDDKRNDDESITLIQNNSYTYLVKVENTKVIFKLNKDGESYSSSFTILEFNNLLDTFKELILTTLLLKDEELIALKEFALLDLKTLKSFESTEEITKFLTQNSFRNVNKSNITIILSLNLDIVIFIHKMNIFVNVEYRRIDRFLKE